MRLGCLNHGLRSVDPCRGPGAIRGLIAIASTPASRAPRTTSPRLSACSSPPLAVMPWKSPPDKEVVARALTNQALDRLF
jgi:hypothetical protein